jgi:hypothetical protein
VSRGSGVSELIVEVEPSHDADNEVSVVGADHLVVTMTAEPDAPGVETAMAQTGEVWAAPELESRKKASFVRAVNGWVGIGLVGIGVVASAALPAYALIKAIEFVFH